MRCCTLGLIAVQKHLNEMGDWILWLLVLDTCKSQKQQSNFAWFCFVPQFTHQFEKEVTAQSVIDGSWNDQDFYRLLSAVHKGCPGIWKATTWNGWELLVLRHLTECISLFWIGCLVGEGTRPTGPPELCEGRTTPAPLEPVVYVCPQQDLHRTSGKGLYWKFQWCLPGRRNEEAGQQVNLKVPNGDLVWFMLERAAETISLWTLQSCDSD